MLRLTLPALLPALLLATTAFPALAADPGPTLPAFDAAAFARPVPNPLWTLEQGQVRTHEGVSVEGIKELDVVTVMGEGPVIVGVKTTTVLDEAYDAGRIVERTFDYYAADDQGNIWYFSEDVTNFRYDDAGSLTGTDTASAWRAGVNDAAPGISMPIEPVLGMTLFQEHAPAEAAMDYFRVVATGLTLEVPGGTFTDVVKMYESSTAETDLREFKYYAPGVGLIRAEENLSQDLTDPKATIDFVR